MPMVLACGLLSYLLGSIPFGFLFARARGVDVRRVGSGNIGATNVFRMVGKSWGVITFVCDMSKGFLPAFFLSRLAVAQGWAGQPDPVAVICGCLAVAGHNWPLFLGFKGGKGVATSTGALLGIAWQPAVAGLVVWALVFLLSRYVSLASLAAAAGAAGAAWLFCRGRGLLVPLTLTVLALLIVWRHRANIARLAQGTEHRFGAGRRAAS